MAGFVVPLFVRLMQLTIAAINQGVAAKLVTAMPYFRYLAVGAGFMNVSAAKSAA